MKKQISIIAMMIFFTLNLFSQETPIKYEDGLVKDYDIMYQIKAPKKWIFAPSDNSMIPRFSQLYLEGMDRKTSPAIIFTKMNNNIGKDLNIYAEESISKFLAKNPELKFERTVDAKLNKANRYFVYEYEDLTRKSFNAIALIELDQKIISIMLVAKTQNDFDLHKAAFNEVVQSIELNPILKQD